LIDEVVDGVVYKVVDEVVVGVVYEMLIGGLMRC